jgi:urease accessory protein
MREITALAPRDAVPALTVTLTFEERRKSRQRLLLDDGSEAALRLPRGTVLAGGDSLQADDGAVIAVKAAPESLSAARTPDPLLLLRAAYHLGNRHVPVEVAAGELRYQHDHVLDGMVQALGLTVEAVTAPFSPEGGAYGHAGGHESLPDRGHSHAHGEEAGHSHAHELVHPHGRERQNR